jgi:hypothetical protein
MSFKKIVRHVPAKEPEYIPDPNQLNILEEIEKTKQNGKAIVIIPPDGEVKWSGTPQAYESEAPTLGMILALHPYNPFNDKQQYGLMLYQFQKPGDKGWKRVILLNQDLSTKIFANGSHSIEFWHSSSIAFIGYAKG